MREARRSGRPVIPVLLAGAPDPRHISGFLMNRSACDLHDDGDGSTFDKLVRAPNATAALTERISADLAPPAGPTAAAPCRRAGWRPASVPDVPRRQGSPYPCLVPLRDTEAAIFFGRGRQVDALIARLAEPGWTFLPVICEFVSS